ncbi:MAG: hypothetical protein ABW033_03830 [Acidimicrobiia bacterium]
MSDSEHEYVLANDTLRGEVVFLRDVALRALHSAIEAQDEASGSHEDWLDEALRLVRDDRRPPLSPRPSV